MGAKLAFGFAVLVIVSPAALVFLWMLSLSLKTEIENIAYPPIFIPATPTLDNFAEVFRASPFARYTLNSGGRPSVEVGVKTDPQRRGD